MQWKQKKKGLCYFCDEKLTLSNQQVHIHLVGDDDHEEAAIVLANVLDKKELVERKQVVLSTSSINQYDEIFGHSERDRGHYPY